MRIILAILIACALVGCAADYNKGFSDGYETAREEFAKGYSSAQDSLSCVVKIDTLTKFLRLYIEPADQDSETIYFTFYKGDSAVSFTVKRPKERP